MWCSVKRLLKSFRLHWLYCSIHDTVLIIYSFVFSCAVFRFNSKAEGPIQLYEETLVLSLFRKSVACAPSSEDRGLEITEDGKFPFTSFVPELCPIMFNTDNENTKILTWYDFVTALSADLDRGFPFSSAGKINTLFEIDSGGVSVRLYVLHAASSELYLPHYDMVSYAPVLTTY